MQITEQDKRDIKATWDILDDVGGYLTVIKSKQNLKNSTEVFTVDPIEFRISQNIKKSFDPKRIFNPGRMYRGV